MLQKTGEAISAPQSPLMWETTFARISNALNDHPIAKSNQSNVSSDNFDIITPDRLILGRNSKRGLPMEGLDLETSANLQRVLTRSHEIFAAWFRQWRHVDWHLYCYWSKVGINRVINDYHLSIQNIMDRIVVYTVHTVYCNVRYDKGVHDDLSQGAISMKHSSSELGLSGLVLMNRFLFSPRYPVPMHT